MRKENLTYLNFRKFVQICATLDRIRAEGIPGDLIEAGCALGGSTIVIGALKPVDANLRVYDVFGMIPPPTDEDPPDVRARYEEIRGGRSRGLGDDVYYGYRDDLRQAVERNLATHLPESRLSRIELIEGKLEETMIVDSTISFAHIDVDWFSPVLASLEHIAPMLSPGGAIILDDYFDWGGCRKAADQFLRTTEIDFERDTSLGNLKLTRPR